MAKKKNAKEKRAATVKGAPAYCRLPERPKLPLPANLAPGRARLIRRNKHKWSNNETIRYMFLERPVGWRGSDDDKQALRAAFDEWKALGIGLSFVETTSAAQRPQIRIGFDDHPEEGSWSYVGREAVELVKDMRQRTMNFGWPLTDAFGYDTALHEIGHALGFEHEHQSPFSGIEWNEAAVRAYFSGAPNNWSDEDIEFNILDKLSPNDVSGSKWDPNSIMHYEFEAGLIKKPARYEKSGLVPNPGLSPADISRVRHFYPDTAAARRRKTLKPFESVVLKIEADEQEDFTFSPDESREYTLQTIGESDSFLSLFEEADGEEIFLGGDDDSGLSQNASLRLRLIAGRSYIVRVRLHFVEVAGRSALIVF